MILLFSFVTPEYILKFEMHPKTKTSTWSSCTEILLTQSNNHCRLASCEKLGRKRKGSKIVSIFESRALSSWKKKRNKNTGQMAA